jgi:hypothetical protein
VERPFQFHISNFSVAKRVPRAPACIFLQAWRDEIKNN